MSRAILRIVLVIAFIPAMAVAENPFDGTWKWDESKNVLSKKPYAFLLQDGIYESKSAVPPLKVKADGSDQPVSGDPSFDTLAVQVVSDHEIKLTYKKNGKEVFSSTRTVSSDGKTLAGTFDTKVPDGGPPVGGQIECMRVADGPAGSHAVSGSWEIRKVEQSSDREELFTLKVDGDQISYSAPNGESYTAKLDGTEAPYRGDPGVTSISVKMLGKNTLETTLKRDDGKVFSVSTKTAAADGKTIKEIVQNKLSDRTDEFVAVKQ